MSLNFGHDEHPPNHIHNIKPLVALPYYQVFKFLYMFAYTNPAQGVEKKPDPFRSHSARWDITTTFAEPNNTQIHLTCHTYDSDTNVTELVNKYELRCLMKDGTIETKLIEEFDLMPYKVTSGKVDDMNHFMFGLGKLYFLSQIQPNYKNMFKATIVVTQTSARSTGNENILEVSLYHRQNMKQLNDSLLQVL